MPVPVDPELCLRPSRIWASLIYGVAGATIFFLIVLPLPLPFELVLVVLVLLALTMAERYRGWLGNFTRLSRREKFWLLRNPEAEEPLQICGVEYVSRWLIVLKARYLRPQGNLVNHSEQKIFRVPLFVDATDEQGFHYLQMQARNGGFQGTV